AGPAALGTACERDHAVGARFVAAFNNRDVSAMRIVTSGERRIEGFVCIKPQSRYAAMAGLELHQHLGELGIAGRPGDQAHGRRLLENAAAFLLRDAADHGECLAFPRRALELIETAENLLLRFVPDATRVV